MEYTNSQAREAIAEIIHSERDRSILLKRLIDGHTIERLAEEHELSPRQVRYILKKNEEILFRHIHRGRR